MLFATTYAHAGILIRLRTLVIDRLAIVPILAPASFEQPLITNRVREEPVLEVVVVCTHVRTNMCSRPP
jgi:uncharacterized protein YqhQ